jgi:hypothetical protein
MSEGSMKGSGVDSADVTLNIECECAQDGCQTDKSYGCGHTFDADLQTDDWGNIDNDVTCPKCNHEFNFQKEQEEIGGDDPDRLHDEMGEW